MRLFKLGFLRRLLRSFKGYHPYEVLEGIKRRLERPRKSLLCLRLLKKKKARQLLAKSDKLHIGCGRVHIEGFINIDAVKLETVDLQCQLNRLLDYFPGNCASEIYVCHVLEHVSWRSLPSYLAQFHHILKASGILRVSVPDIEKVVSITERPDLPRAQLELLQGIIMGGQGHSYNFHQTAFWPAYLESALTAAGFQGIERYPARPHFAGSQVEDGSTGAGLEPFGVAISLNMLARKGALT